MQNQTLFEFVDIIEGSNRIGGNADDDRKTVTLPVINRFGRIRPLELPTIRHGVMALGGSIVGNHSFMVEISGVDYIALEEISDIFADAWTPEDSQGNPVPHKRRYNVFQANHVAFVAGLIIRKVNQTENVKVLLNAVSHCNILEFQPYVPDLYDGLVAAMRWFGFWKVPPGPTHIVIGDSHAVDLQLPGYTTIAFPGMTLLNLGPTLATIVGEWTKSIIVCAGANDCRKSTKLQPRTYAPDGAPEPLPYTELRARARSVLKICNLQAPTASIGMLELLPQHGYFVHGPTLPENNGRSQIQQLVKNFNDRLDEMIGFCNENTVNGNRPFYPIHFHGRFDDELKYGPDGLHLFRLVYIGEFRNAIREQLVD